MWSCTVTFRDEMRRSQIFTVESRQDVIVDPQGVLRIKKSTTVVTLQEGGEDVEKQQETRLIVAHGAWSSVEMSRTI